MLIDDSEHLARFSLSCGQAAELLGLSPDEVLDLVRLRALPGYLPAPGVVNHRPAWRFDPAHVAHVARALGDLTTPESTVERLAVITAVRDYLAKVAPTHYRDVAVEEGRPLLAPLRGSGMHAHVKLDTVMSWIEHNAPIPPDHPRRHRVKFAPVVTAALADHGARRVRGIYLAAEGRQVWDWWWRLPASLWSESGFDVEDAPVFGEHVPGDEVRVDDQGPYVDLRAEVGR